MSWWGIREVSPSSLTNMARSWYKKIHLSSSRARKILNIWSSYGQRRWTADLLNVNRTSNIGCYVSSVGCCSWGWHWLLGRSSKSRSNESRTWQAGRNTSESGQQEKYCYGMNEAALYIANTLFVTKSNCLKPDIIHIQTQQDSGYQFFHTPETACRDQQYDIGVNKGARYLVCNRIHGLPRKWYSILFVEHVIPDHMHISHLHQ